MAEELATQPTERREIGTIWLGTEKQLRVGNYKLFGYAHTEVRLWALRPGGEWRPQKQSFLVNERELPTLIRTLLKAHEAHRGKS